MFLKTEIMPILNATIKSKIKSTQTNKTISFYRKNSTLFNVYVCFFVNIRALES